MNLDVYPIKYPDSDLWVGYDRLSFITNYELFNTIQALRAYYIHDDIIFQIFTQSGIVEKTTNVYGDKLTYVRAEEFRKVHPVISGRSASMKWNNAVLLMLRNLKEDMPVVIYWC